MKERKEDELGETCDRSVTFITSIAFSRNSNSLARAKLQALSCRKYTSYTFGVSVDPD